MLLLPRLLTNSRCLGVVHTHPPLQLNVLRYITAPVPVEENDVPIDIKKLVNFKVKDFKLPYTVTNNNLSYFLKAEPENLSYLNMYI